MATAKQIIDKATSYIGTREDARGNVLFNIDYYGYPLNYRSAWCCTFVWDIFRMCGASELFYDGKKTAYCPYVGDWAIANKLIVSKNEGRYGDVVLFDWDKNGNSDHVGFIISKNADGTYTTVEGNTSTTSASNGGTVMKRTRYVSNINYIIRPKYELEPIISPKPAVTSPTIELGNRHAVNFCGFADKSKVLQEALNMDYRASLVVDGDFGTTSKKALGNHYVKKGEKQYMVTALEILLMMNGYDAGGVENPGVFGYGLESAVKKFQKDKNLTPDGIAGRNTFLELIK